MKRLKTIVLAIAIAMIANVATAQGTKVHVVERGETIESIAKKYNVTKDELIKQNPDVAQFVYVGMELTIPATAVREQVVSSITETKTEQSYNTFTSSFAKTSSTQTSVESSDDVEFHNFGAAYIAAFEAFDAGYYGICGNVINSNGGLGMQLFVGFNFGLVPSDYAGCLAKFGPSYSCALNESVAFHVPLTFDLSGTSVTEEDGVGSEMKLAWGLSLTPSLTFKLGGLYLNAGVALMWGEGTSKIEPAAMLGIGFDI